MALRSFAGAGFRDRAAAGVAIPAGALLLGGLSGCRCGVGVLREVVLTRLGHVTDAGGSHDGRLGPKVIALRSPLSRDEEFAVDPGSDLLARDTEAVGDIAGGEK